MKKLTHKSSDFSRHSLKTPENNKKQEHLSTRDTYIQQKLKESLDSHLESWKSNKNLISIHPHNKNNQYSPLLSHRKCKSDLSEESDDDLQTTAKENLSNLEKILNLVQTVLLNLDEDDDLNLRMCKKNLNRIVEMMSREVKNSKLLLKFLENFIQKQAFELNSMRKLMEKDHQIEIQELNEKFEEVIEELMKQNKDLTRQVNENKAKDDKIETLERLLTQSDKQILEKIDEITEKNQEIISLKDYIGNLTDDLHKLKGDMKELDRFFRHQQENSQNRIKDLLAEIDHLQQESEKVLKNSESQQSQLKKSAESYKTQFGKVYDALLKADDQLELLKHTFHTKESSLTQENSMLTQQNQDLQCKLSSLQSLNDRLKKDLELALDRIEAREFIINRNKEEEIHKIQSTVMKLTEDLSTLHKLNQSLTKTNQKLESDLQRLHQEKQNFLQKSEKKVKKIRRTQKSPIFT